MRRGTLSIDAPELFGVTESTVTLAFAVHDANGNGSDAAARVTIDGAVRAESQGDSGTRLVRVEGLAPGTGYALGIEAADGTGATHDAFFPERVHTLPAPDAPETGSFATLNDVHFGESRIGGVLTADHEYGDAAPGFPVIQDSDYETPYAEFMNADAVMEINRIGVDHAVIKGDIADAGLPEQFEAAARCFAGFDAPHSAFLGNHDYIARSRGIDVDGYALLGQPPAPRAVELGGWRLLLLDTTVPGVHEGAFDESRREWLADALSEAPRVPTLLVCHHQPVPPEHRDGYPNSIGLDPEDSVALFELIGQAANVKGVLIGHTHRNRVRRYAPAGDVPFAEVIDSKDYPGGFGHYRLFEDGSFRQEVRRTPSPRALHHATRCRGLFRGGYRTFALGRLEERCYVAGC